VEILFFKLKPFDCAQGDKKRLQRKAGTWITDKAQAFAPSFDYAQDDIIY
jgi:hypothetical protein